MPSRTIVVFGPAGCGKTTHKDALARHFGLTEVIDDFDPHRDRLTPGALHLTSEPFDVPGAECFAFAYLQLA